jgi:hypothetical protein
MPCQWRRIAALLVAFAAASSEIEGKPSRAAMFAAARTPTSAMLTTPSTPPSSVTARVSDSQSFEIDRQRVIGRLQARCLRIPIRDQSLETRFVSSKNRRNVVATATENKNSPGAHRKKVFWVQI